MIDVLTILSQASERVKNIKLKGLEILGMAQGVDTPIGRSPSNVKKTWGALSPLFFLIATKTKGGQTIRTKRAQKKRFFQ